MIYDVGKKADTLGEVIPYLQELIDKDEIDSMALIVIKKDEKVSRNMHQRVYIGNTTPFDWIAIFEIMKDFMKLALGSMTIEGKGK